MPTTNEKLTMLKHLSALATRTKAETDAINERIQELVTVGGQPNVIEEIQVNGVKQEVVGKVVNLLMATKVSELTNDSNFQNADQVASAVQAAIAATGHAHFEKVDAVPSADAAEDNVLYLVMNATTNHYDIYAKVGGEVVLIDDTTVDLSAYSTTEQVNALISAAIEALKIGDYAKASDLTAAVNRITAVENKLAGIDTTVVAYVTSAIEALKIGDYAKASTVSELAGRVATIEADFATKTFAEEKANAAESNAKSYADSLAGNYDAKGSAATAESNAKSYADGLAGNYDAKGSAATAESNAKAYVDGMIATDAEVTAALDAVFGAQA